MTKMPYDSKRPTFAAVHVPLSPVGPKGGRTFVWVSMSTHAPSSSR